MTLPRVVLIALLVATTCVSTVFMRQAMASTSRRIQQLHNRQVRLEQDLWTRQMELARLRIPEKIRQRVESLDLSLELPKIVRKTANAKNAAGVHD